VVNETHRGNKPDRQRNQTNTRHNNEQHDQNERAPLGRVASRLRGAGLPTDRFIDVEDGRKQSYDHSQHEPDAVSGNYGVYCGRGLVGFDIDDYNEEADTTALETVPSTFATSTPHGGEHRYYKSINGPEVILKSATGGAENASLSWGEIYAGGKYLVGPGSHITKCDKAHCRECRRSGGSYSIVADRPIAEIAPGQILGILSADPKYADDAPQSALEIYGARDAEPGLECGSGVGNISSPTEEILAIEDPDRRLWRSILRHHKHNDVETGVEVVRILDRAEELGIGRWQASEYLMEWTDTGRLKKTHAPNRVAPAWARLRASDEHTEGTQTGLDSFQ
jgi:hypothetical protein